MEPVQQKAPSYPSRVDLAIIGGGISGAAVARDAALRGIRVALFEKNTFGSGTSGKSSKLIHGGIRYLELSWNAFLGGRFADAWKNLKFVFVSLSESRRLERIGQGRVKPISLVIPIYRNGGRAPILIYLGAFLYYVLAILSGRARRPSILPSPEAARKAIPGLRSEGLAGAIRIWDRFTDDTALVKATIESARQAGAQCFEESPVTAFEKTTEGYRVCFCSQGQNLEVSASTLVNASGPWIDHTRKLNLKADTSSPCIHPVAGSHLTLESFLPESALLQAEDNRVFFVINLGNGLCRTGTTERPCNDPDHVEATPDEVTYLLRSLRRYFPDRSFDETDIHSTDAGVRPLAAPKQNATAVNAISREHVLNVDADGVFHLIGVKLTDHRRAAQKTVDRVGVELRRRHRKIMSPCRTHLEPLPR